MFPMWGHEKGLPTGQPFFMHQAFASAFDDLDAKGVSLLDLIHDVKPFGDPAEARVVAVEVGGVFAAMHNEKL